MASNGEPDSLAVMKRGYTSARKADSLSAGRRGMEPRAHRPCPPLRLGSLDGIVKAFTERGIPLRQANYERGIPFSPQCSRSLSPHTIKFRRGEYERGIPFSLQCSTFVQ